MAEVVKSALIGSEALFDYLEARTSDDPAERLRDIDFLEHCVVESARIKIDIVNADPYELDRRRVLNLGHTIGHAIEAARGYEGIKHGQAVAMGLVAAMRIAIGRGVLDRSVLDRTRALLEWCRLPVSIEAVDRDALLGAIAHDKKVKDGKLHFVLPVAIGNVEIVDDVTRDEIVTAIDGG